MPREKTNYDLPEQIRACLSCPYPECVNCIAPKRKRRKKKNEKSEREKQNKNEKLKNEKPKGRDLKDE
ncbi:MAG: hypothetical protein GX684_02215 [Ruminococcaceae bacterium]|nr:hypothetical protein [Oscillospiraceae bacterium]